MASPLNSLRDLPTGRSVSGFKATVALGADHRAHLVIDLDGNVLDLPLEPDQASQLGLMLVQAAQAVKGIGSAVG